MKKLVLVLVLFAILATGTVFADHPKGFGIGVQGGTSANWDGWSYFNYGAALSLKLPSLPVFWAVRIDSWPSYLYLTVSGDKYLIDSAIAKDIGLHWYLGVGVGVGLGLGSPLAINAAARLPIGLSWQPIPLLELFLQVVPSLGVAVLPDFHFPSGGWGGDFGIRLWF